MQINVARKIIALTSVSTFCILTLHHNTATAEDARGSALFEEVLVTATKVGETSLQDTPIAMTAFSEQYLADMMITDVRDLAMMTPGLTMSSNSNMAQIYIRGIGSNNVFAGSDPSSTIHYDGVYLARPQSGFANFVDVERVEILRGPQGTLYGRNSVGGTINIVSRRPSLDSFKAEGVFNIGNKSFYRGEGYISVPVVSDKIAVSIAAQKSDRGAFRENIAPGGHDVDDEDIQSFRGQVLWKVSDRVDIIARADYYKDDSTLYSGSSSPIGPLAGNPPLASSIIGDSRKVALNAPSFIDREAYGFSLELNAEMSENWSVKSLTAYRRNDNFIASDPDVTEIDTGRTLLWEDQDQISQEFNAIGSYDSLKLFFGLFYLKENIDSIVEVQSRPTGRSTKMNPIVDTETWAAFGQLQYSVTDIVTLTVGGRYTEETKDWVKNYHGTFITDTDTQLTDLNLPPEQQKSKEFTPKFGIELRPNDDYLIYGTISRGFKSGGFNLTATVPGGYDPETLWAYEIGVNGRHLDGRFTSRLSAFYYDYKDLQVQAFIVPGVASITNAASAKLKGIEAEISGQITDEFVIRGSLSYLDATYSHYPDAPVGGGIIIDASGKRLNNAPKWSGSALAEYTKTFDWGTLRFTGEYGWQSEVFFTVTNNMLHRQGNYGIVNGSIAYESPTGQFGVSLWGRNLFDKDYLTAAGTIMNPAGRYGPIRTYGLRFSVKY